MDLSALFELNELALQEGKSCGRYRFLFEEVIQNTGKHFLGIVGPRGVGKSTLLKQLNTHLSGCMYISLDTLEETNLFDIAKTLVESYQIECLLLDEVHFLTNIDQELKKIYDFLNVRVIFTSSMALAMNQSSFDLSRRVKLKTLYPFSFREYLSFVADQNIESLTIQNIYNKEWTFEHMKWGHLFEPFLKGGVYPFSLDEPNPLPLLQNILDKVILHDIPAVAKLYPEELECIRKLVTFVGRSEVDGISYSSLSKNLGITKYKAEQYTDLLEKAFVLHRVFPNGTGVLKEPKVLLHIPYRLLFKPYEECVGALREDYVVSMLKACEYPVGYLKTMRGKKTPDFVVPWSNEEDLVIEVGGKGKGYSQFKNFQASKKLILTHGDRSDGDRRPLWLCGFLK